ncbi:MAG: polysaccharide biosynthesis protein [Desulfurivibrio sp.]|nr:polysaccharide biosynthesis protein [Desulfurivibrio sp.]
MRVQTVPSMPEIVSGEAGVDQLREIDLEDLLGRDPVPARPELLAASVEGRVVLVTGAGGSIGSELCRQIAALRPAALVLFEASEFALYAIDQELRQWQRERKACFSIYAISGTVCHRGRVEAVLRDYRVQTIDHAAAYKHVPLVNTTFARSSQQRFRQQGGGRGRFGTGGGALCVDLHRQGGTAHQCDGRQQTPSRVDSAGVGGTFHGYRLFHGAFWQCAGVVRFGGAAFPAPDRGRRPGYRYPSGDHPLFY